MCYTPAFPLPPSLYRANLLLVPFIWKMKISISCIRPILDIIKTTIKIEQSILHKGQNSLTLCLNWVTFLTLEDLTDFFFFFFLYIHQACSINTKKFNPQKLSAGLPYQWTGEVFRRRLFFVVSGGDRYQLRWQKKTKTWGEIENKVW